MGFLDPYENLVIGLKGTIESVLLEWWMGVTRRNSDKQSSHGLYITAAEIIVGFYVSMVVSIELKHPL